LIESSVIEIRAELDCAQLAGMGGKVGTGFTGKSLFYVAQQVPTSLAEMKNQKRPSLKPESRNPLVSAVSCKYGETMKVKVVVMPKAAVLDPQGNAVRNAMRHLGMPEVHSVRIGKYMEIEVDGENGELESRLHGLCRDLLSNPVIEDYELTKNEERR